MQCLKILHSRGPPTSIVVSAVSGATMSRQVQFGGAGWMKSGNGWQKEVVYVNI